MKFSVLASALGLWVFLSGPGLALDYGAASPSPAPAAKLDKAAIKARTEECAKEADVRGLTGKDRRRFKEKCKKGQL